MTAEQFLAQVKSLHLEGDREFVTHFRNVTERPGRGKGAGAGQLAGAGAGGGSYEAPFYVDGYNQPKAFLATPLPLPYKFNFFWKQIWEQKVAVIVMLENIAENGKVRGTGGLTRHVIIMEKAFSWLNAATTTFRFPTLRHY